MADQQRSRTKGRPRGRPRHDGSRSEGSPRDAIVQCATQLFAEHGYASTTVTDIATAAGLQQSSLYYWFSSKEQILQATLAVNRQALAFADRVLAEPAPAAEKLYRLLRYDALQLCLSPFDFNEIERLAEAQPEDFSDFWRDYRVLNEHVVTLILEGIGAGTLKSCDAELAASTALCLNEGIQKRYRVQSRHGSDSGNPFVLAQRQAQDYAAASASTTLCALLVDPAALPALEQHVDMIDG
jgi:TetR/AcrR family transcriptional regulator